MDRELNQNYRRRQIAQRIVIVAAFLGLIVTAAVSLPGWLKPSIARARINTARADSGPLEATITASGLVTPEFEQVLSSPVNARILKILKRPGAVLTPGEPILQLDLNESRLALEKLAQQIALKQNAEDKARLDLENTLNDLQSRWEIKQLEFKSAEAATARNRTLHAEGLLSKERLREIELVEERTGFEVRQLDEAKRNAQKSTQTHLAGLALEMKTLEQERAEAQRQLELATTKADRAGVLTWVVNEEGATIQKGAILARIADLRSFRVEATVSDLHASRLATGQNVTIKINDSALPGAIARINPAVTGGVIPLVISLENKASELLRANLRVDVLIATERRDKVLRIRKGPFANGANGAGASEVFVVRGNVAIKTPVRLGLASFDHYEVMQGLIEGDEVIISDMSEYLHAREVKLK
ncbi:MAG: efflux RND transporter periplasmic adaptor subunit [Blastocatellia bacterium]